MRYVSTLASAFAVERVLSYASAPITPLMLVALVAWGPIGCFAVGFVLDFLFAVFVLELHLRSTRLGFDVVGVSVVREWIYAHDDAEMPHSDAEFPWPVWAMNTARVVFLPISLLWVVLRPAVLWFWQSRSVSIARSWSTRQTKRLLRWIIGSYWLMILIGSMVPVLEPDYLTLFLRKEEESRLSVLFRVTVPAVAWSIGVWTLIYWLAELGVRWAIAIAA